MRTEKIAQFLRGETSAKELESEAASSVQRLGPGRENVYFEEMRTDFTVTPQAAVRLCDAAIAGEISPESLRTISFLMIASSKFQWQDEVVAEVLDDWSCPEINYPLDAANLIRFRRWLLREEPYPEKPAPSVHSTSAAVISTTAAIPVTSRVGETAHRILTRLGLSRSA